MEMAALFGAGVILLAGCAGQADPESLAEPSESAAETAGDYVEKETASLEDFHLRDKRRCMRMTTKTVL